MDTDHHTWRRHHLTHVSTKLSLTNQPPPHPSPLKTNPLFIRSIWFAEQTLSLRKQSHLEPGHIARSRKTTLQPTTPPDIRNSAPLSPHGHLFNIRSYPITRYVYTLILLRCSRSRHHSYESFCTLYSVTLTLLCTTWWWPPHRPKHVVASYLHHITK